MSPSSSDAAEALAAMQASQARLAAAAHCPPERHFAFAGLLGGLVVTPALPTIWSLVAEGVILLGIVLVVRWDRRRTGMFINGYRRGKTRWVTFAMLAAIIGLYALSAHAAISNGDRVTPAILGVVTAIIATLGSVQWQRVFLRELGA